MSLVKLPDWWNRFWPMTVQKDMPGPPWIILCSQRLDRKWGFTYISPIVILCKKDFVCMLLKIPKMVGLFFAENFLQALILHHLYYKKNLTGIKVCFKAVSNFKVCPYSPRLLFCCALSAKFRQVCIPE